ncbi:hypothetical protein OJ590_08820 [Streptococcus anginosus]|nr:hypothetical protein [Streptococcus anginosus]MCW0978861.1 hypothetical protein [Streptococcus anginosus]MCW1061970.1 hypothetical protein [Streptococcus anginosus]MDB8651254.1 hypothetical protein [Streptococcus anginosus]MDB8654243.1 hypothetical protein [Streptococcus anginosus]MED5926742.1 hypothetical protein [Streptococcus anginosus]
MTRPKRYPYSRNQWEKVVSKFYAFNGVEYARFVKLENRITGEVRDV